MTKVQTTLLSIISVIMFALAGLALTANAQAQLELSNATDASYDIETRASADCDDTDERCEPGTRGDTSVARELDKATPAAATNVCDGATCADGSCVATPDMCGAEEMVADSVCSGYLCDDGQCVSDEVWCGVDFDFEIDATVAAADSVCNGYLCDDGTCVSSEAMCAIDFDTLPAVATRCSADSPIRCGDGSCADEASICRAIESRMIPDTDSDGRPDVRDMDGDGLGDESERAQNHNSSRSNRTEGVAPDADFNDPDDDGDGLPTDAARGGVDKSSPLLFDTLRNRPVDEDGEIIAGSDTPQPAVFMKFDDIKGEVQEDANTGERRLSRVAVAARDLRNWTTEDREAFTRLRDEVASNTPEAASLRVTEQLLSDERIESIEATETEARIEYRTTMRLLGFIPLERTVTARAQANGAVEIDYPWYRFLSATPDNQRINSLLLDTLDIVVLVPGRAG